MSDKLNKVLQFIFKEGKEFKEEKEVTKKGTIKEIPAEVTIGLEIWNEESINNSIAVADLPDEEKDELKEKVFSLSLSLKDAINKIDWNSIDIESMPEYWYKGTDGWAALAQGDISKLEEYVNEVIDWVNEISEEANKSKEEFVENRRKSFYEGEKYFEATRKLALLEEVGTEFTHKDFDELNNDLLCEFAYQRGLEFTSRKNIIERLIESGKVCKKDIVLFLENYKKKHVNEVIKDNINNLVSQWPPEIDFKTGEGPFEFDSETSEYSLLDNMEGEEWENYLDEMAKRAFAIEYDSTKDVFKVYSIIGEEFEKEEGERFPIEDEDKTIIENIVKGKKYTLIECRGALKISNKKNIMEIIVEKDNHRTLIEYDDAAIIKPWKTGQFEFKLLQEALDNIHIPLKKLQKEADEREKSISKKMLIFEKVQRQSTSLSKNLPLSEKERREFRSEEIINKFIKLESKQSLKENTYTDFLINYSTEIKEALLKLIELRKKYEAGKISEKELQKTLEVIMGIYDKPVVDLIANFEETLSIEDIAKTGAKIQRDFNSKPEQVLNAINDFYNNLT